MPRESRQEITCPLSYVQEMEGYENIENEQCFETPHQEIGYEVCRSLDPLSTTSPKYAQSQLCSRRIDIGDETHYELLMRHGSGRETIFGELSDVERVHENMNITPSDLNGFIDNFIEMINSDPEGYTYPLIEIAFGADSLIRRQFYAFRDIDPATFDAAFEDQVLQVFPEHSAPGELARKIFPFGESITCPIDTGRNYVELAKKEGKTEEEVRCLFRHMATTPSFFHQLVDEMKTDEIDELDEIYPHDITEMMLILNHPSYDWFSLTSPAEHPASYDWKSIIEQEFQYIPSKLRDYYFRRYRWDPFYSQYIDDLITHPQFTEIRRDHSLPVIVAMGERFSDQITSKEILDQDYIQFQSNLSHYLYTYWDQLPETMQTELLPLWKYSLSFSELDDPRYNPNILDRDLLERVSENVLQEIADPTSPRMWRELVRILSDSPRLEHFINQDLDRPDSIYLWSKIPLETKRSVIFGDDYFKTLQGLQSVKLNYAEHWGLFLDVFETHSDPEMQNLAFMRLSRKLETLAAGVVDDMSFLAIPYRMRQRMHRLFFQEQHPVVGNDLLFQAQTYLKNLQPHEHSQREYTEDLLKFAAEHFPDALAVREGEGEPTAPIAAAPLRGLTNRSLQILQREEYGENTTRVRNLLREIELQRK